MLRDVVDGLAGAAARAGVALDVEDDPHVDVPLRRRMLRIVAENLPRTRSATPATGASCTFTVARQATFAS